MRKISFFLLVVICVGALALTGCAGEKPSDVVVKFYETLQKNNLDQAYEMMSAYYHETKDATAFKAEVEALFNENGTLKSVTVGKTEMQGSRGSTVEVTLVWTKDGVDTQDSKRISVPNNKGKWKIDAAAIR